MFPDLVSRLLWKRSRLRSRNGTAWHGPTWKWKRGFWKWWIRKRTSRKLQFYKPKQRKRQQEWSGSSRWRSQERQAAKEQHSEKQQTQHSQDDNCFQLLIILITFVNIGNKTKLQALLKFKKHRKVISVLENIFSHSDLASNLKSFTFLCKFMVVRLLSI